MVEVPNELPVLYTKTDAAMLLGCSYETLRKLCRVGAVKTVRLGKRAMVPRAEVERVAREGTS